MDLEEFIETLSKEERQRHKDLIEECRMRSEETRRTRRMFCERPVLLSDKADPTFFRVMN